MPCQTIANKPRKSCVAGCSRKLNQTGWWCWWKKIFGRNKTIITSIPTSWQAMWRVTKLQIQSNWTLNLPIEYHRRLDWFAQVILNTVPLDEKERQQWKLKHFLFITRLALVHYCTTIRKIYGGKKQLAGNCKTGRLSLTSQDKKSPNGQHYVSFYRREVKSFVNS